MATKEGTSLSDESVGPSSEMRKAVFLCVIGGPAVGKGTVCARLAHEREDVVHVSVGDVLRTEAGKPGTKYSNIIECMREGSLVPNSIVQEILEGFLIEKYRQKEKTCFLIDGFPRSRVQAEDFQKRGFDVKRLIHFDGSEEVMRARMTKRATIEGRIDDNIEVHKKRYQDFIDQCGPIVAFYEAKGVYHKVDCDRDLDKIYDEVYLEVAIERIRLSWEISRQDVDQR